MISDKFGIIKQNTIQFDKSFKYDLPLLLCNFFETNVLNVTPYAIKNFLCFLDSDELKKINDSVQTTLINYLNNQRRQFLKLVKQNKITLESIINFLNIFKVKIYNISNILLTIKIPLKKIGVIMYDNLIDQIFMNYIIKTSLCDTKNINYFFSSVLKIINDFENFDLKYFISQNLGNDFKYLYGVDIPSMLIKTKNNVSKVIKPLLQNKVILCIIEYLKDIKDLKVVSDLKNLSITDSSQKILFALNSIIEKYKNFNSTIYFLQDSNNKKINKFLLEKIGEFLEHKSLVYKFEFFKKYENIFKNMTCDIDLLSISNSKAFFMDQLYGNIYYVTKLEFYSYLYNIKNFKNLITNYNKKFLTIRNIENKKLPILRQKEIVKLFEKNILEENIEQNNMLISSIIKLFINDGIFNLLEKSLIERLLYHNSSLDLERQQFANMYPYFTPKQIYNYKAIIEDYYDTMTQDINIDIINNNKVLLVRRNAWNLNFSEGFLEIFKQTRYTNFFPPSSNNDFVNSINFCINSVYKEKSLYNLLLYLHIGFVDVKFNINNKSVKIKMLPIHSVILNIFNSEKTTTLIYICNFLPNYSKEFIEIILQTFYISDILFEKDNNIFVNMNYSGGYINLINIFNEINNTETKEKITLEKNLANRKKDILISIINHLVKNNSINKLILFNKCCSTNKVFLTSKKLFDECIKEMIDKEYIKCNENIVSNIL